MVCGRAMAGAALLVVVVASACSPGVPFEGEISAQPSAALELSWAKAKRTAHGIEVSGQIRQVHCCRYVRGYIRFDAKGANGANLASTTARWGDFNPRQLHSAWFDAVLPLPTENRVSVIDIQFVTEPGR